jgi:hypothetical protein
MRLTNREELRAQREARSALVSAARTTTAQAPAGTDTAGLLQLFMYNYCYELT